MSDAGEIAFISGITGEGVNPSANAGIFSGPADDISLFIRKGNAVPGESNTFLGDFTNVAINTSGELAIIASVSDGNSPLSNSPVLFSGNRGTIHKVVGVGDSLAGFELDEVVANLLGFSGLTINDEGSIVVQAVIASTPGALFGDTSLLDGKEPQLAYRQFELIEGTNDKLVFFGPPSANNSGSIAFTAGVGPFGFIEGQAILRRELGVTDVARSGSQTLCTSSSYF